MGESRRTELILRYRRPLIIAGHALMVAAAFGLAFLARFDLTVPSTQWDLMLTALPLLVGIRLVTFAIWRLFEGMWRYVSMSDLMSIAKAVVIGTGLFVTLHLLIFGYGSGFPRSVFLLEPLFTILLVGGTRF